MGGAVYFRDSGGNLHKVSADDPLPTTDAGAVQSSTVGQPGGPAGPLDQNGEIPLAQMPIDGLNFQGAWDASTNTPTLADGTGTAGDLYRVSVAGSQDLGSGTLVFEVGDHVIYEGNVWQQFDPPPAIAWGDITGTLSDQTDLQTALDAKADDSSLATVATSGDYADLSGRPIVHDSGTVALHLAGEELVWPIDVTTGKIRLYNSTPGSVNTYYGFGILNQTFVYQVDGSGSVHSFRSVDGSDNAVVLLEIGDDGEIVAHRALHMSEQKIINLGDPTNARDAANKQYVDSAVAGPDSGIASTTLHNSGTGATLDTDASTVQLIDSFAAGGDWTLTLPAGPTTGKVITAKRLDAVTAHDVLIATPSGEQIDGSLDALTLGAQWAVATLMYDGSNWQILSSVGV